MIFLLLDASEQKDVLQVVAECFDPEELSFLPCHSRQDLAASSGFLAPDFVTPQDSLSDLPGSPGQTLRFKFTPSVHAIVALHRRGVNVAVLASEVTTDFIAAADIESISTTGKISLPLLLASLLSSDRTDQLFPTIVTDQYGIALGLAYSSVESLSRAIQSSSGVYHSRKRGLWHKGLSSGATQKLLRIKLDCDSDTLLFRVIQNKPGFCHLNTHTCFGNSAGISSLNSVIQSRKISSPPESYTHRLFNDSTLLASKILEEANELCEANGREDVAWEAADLIYFILVKCAKEGVDLSDIEANLDIKAKSGRRPGNAKPDFLKAASELLQNKTANSTAPKNLESLSSNPKPIEIKLKVYDLDSVSNTERDSLFKRPILDLQNITARVGPIVEAVRKRGDEAIKEFTQKFDGVLLKETVINAPFDPILFSSISPQVKDSIDKAFSNIQKFHSAQVKSSDLVVETMPGVTCSRGTAVLPSTALMLGIPAMVAGCPKIVLASPPRKDGSPVPEVVYVANKIGAHSLVLAGGSQAVAAMAFGTKTISKVDKIVGPGNQYVTAAKMMLQNDTSAMISIDMPAGPSELLVIADASSNPQYVAADLLSQAEHGIDSQVVLVAVGLPKSHLDDIQAELSKQGEALPRKEIVRVSISKSYIIRVNGIEEAMQFSNSYAPEHLILHVDSPKELIQKVTNAGSVFVGKWSPERLFFPNLSCGDYASGTNHTLPTYGYARMYSGVSTDTFLKFITSQQLDQAGLKNIGEIVMNLAEVESLEAHRNAVAIRMKDLQ